MEGDETNMSAVLQLLKQIKKDVESLKDQNKQHQCSRSRQHSCCDGAGGEEHSGQQETFQRNHSQRLYSFQGRDDLGLR